jgi:hypothetical protein
MGRDATLRLVDSQALFGLIKLRRDEIGDRSVPQERNDARGRPESRAVGACVGERVFRGSDGEACLSAMAILPRVSSGTPAFTRNR